MTTFRPTTKDCRPRNCPRCAFLDDIILPKMSHKQVQKFGQCAGTEIRPNRNLSEWSCALERSIIFSVRHRTVNNTMQLPLTRYFGEMTWSLTHKFPISLMLINCQRCLLSKNEEIFVFVSCFSNYFATNRTCAVHTMQFLHLSSLLQASIDWERLWHQLYWF